MRLKYEKKYLLARDFGHQRHLDRLHQSFRGKYFINHDDYTVTDQPFWKDLENESSITESTESENSEARFTDSDYGVYCAAPAYKHTLQRLIQK